jgi:outer membrane protein OmpA-like peptidoglycan-associated protein
MNRYRSLPRLSVIVLAAAVLGGCANKPPLRPVPPPEAVPELPPWYPEQGWDKADGSEAYYNGKVVFDTARSTIRPQSQKVLEQLLAWLQANPSISRVRLEGHTDNRASDEYNQGLSERRAIAVADWLVDHGLDHNRILAVAFGETRPLALNDSSVGRQENRRASFFPAEVAGRRFDDKDPANGGLVLTVLSKEEREAMKRKGTVPKYVPPPIKPEKDIFKPIEREKEQDLADKLLGEGPKVIDAATGEVKTDKPAE